MFFKPKLKHLLFPWTLKKDGNFILFLRENLACFEEALYPIMASKSTKYRIKTVRLSKITVLYKHAEEEFRKDSLAYIRAKFEKSRMKELPPIICTRGLLILNGHHRHKVYSENHVKRVQVVIIDL